MFPFILNSRKCKLVYSDRKQISCCLGMGNRERQAGGITGGHGAVDIFMILITVMVSWVDAYVKTDQIVSFKHMQFIGCQLDLKKAVFFLNVCFTVRKLYFLILTLESSTTLPSEHNHIQVEAMRFHISSRLWDRAGEILLQAQGCMA